MDLTGNGLHVSPASLSGVVADVLIGASEAVRPLSSMKQETSVS